MCNLGNLYSWSTSNVANPVLNHPQFHISPGMGDRNPPKLDTTLSNIIEFPRKDATCIHIKNCNVARGTQRGHGMPWAHPRMPH